MAGTILSFRNITKHYPGVTALNNVSMDFLKGEVHAIVGENGAGKSSLIKVLSGAVQNDTGTIVIDGISYDHMTPLLAKACGVEVIYQEYNLIRTLSVAENICLEGNQKGIVNFKEMAKKAQQALDFIHVDLKTDILVRELSSAHQQLVEIAKAISKDAKILVMDEPTAQLTVNETEKLYEVIRTLKKNGVTVLYISHRMEEIFEIADRVSVMRDGEYIKTLDIRDTNQQELISLMVGRELTDQYPEQAPAQKDVLLEIKNLTGGMIKGVSLTVNKGEIVGIAGLVGAGRTELAHLIYGADRVESGEVYIDGEKVTVDSPTQAIKLGIGLIPEDRQASGCFLQKDISWNVSITNLRALSRSGVVDNKRVEKQAEYYRDLFSIKTPSLRQLVVNLSGGNQQKVVLARVLAADPKIIIFDEPTRGIDVGARYEIYKLISNLAEQGKAIIMISSDLEELLGVSDRILVMADGAIQGQLRKGEFNKNHILRLASMS